LLAFAAAGNPPVPLKGRLRSICSFFIRSCLVLEGVVQFVELPLLAFARLHHW
jgi:hypothetical protein